MGKCKFYEEDIEASIEHEEMWLDMENKVPNEEETDCLICKHFKEVDGEYMMGCTCPEAIYAAYINLMKGFNKYIGN